MRLTREMKMLTTIFVVFTLTYISRTIYDFVAKMDGSFTSTFWGVALPILWDVLPILMMLQYHYTSLHAQRTKEILPGQVDSSRDETATVLS